MDANIRDEEEIVWLHPPERYAYLRERVATCAQRRFFARRHCPAGPGTAPPDGHLVAYAVLKASAGSEDGWFARRFWWVKKFDRFENHGIDRDGGFYERGGPVEAVLPESVQAAKPSTPGWKDEPTPLPKPMGGVSIRRRMNIASDTNSLGTLPALKKLGKLADLRPVLIIDTREQTPLPITRLEVIRAGLQTADYSFVGGEGVFGIERKSIEDLVACCMGENRERFEREMHRLRGFRFKRLLIVGPKWMIEGQRYKSRIKPSAVLHSLAAWEARYDLPVVFVEHPAQGATLVEGWVWWFARQMVEDANSLLRGSRSNEPVPAEVVSQP